MKKLLFMLSFGVLMAGTSMAKPVPVKTNASHQTTSSKKQPAAAVQVVVKKNEKPQSKKGITPVPVKKVAVKKQPAKVKHVVAKKAPAPQRKVAVYRAPSHAQQHSNRRS